jgi:hypothetical protein
MAALTDLTFISSGRVTMTEPGILSGILGGPEVSSSHAIHSRSRAAKIGIDEGAEASRA